MRSIVRAPGRRPLTRCWSAKPPIRSRPVAVLALAALVAAGGVGCGGKGDQPGASSRGASRRVAEDARLQSALALLRSGQVGAGLEELRRATAGSVAGSTAGGATGAAPAPVAPPHGGRVPPWLPEVAQILVNRRWLIQADSLLQAHPAALDANADLAILAAQLARKAGRVDQAAALYRAALRDATVVPDAQTELARLELDRGRFAEAADAAREALRLQPERTEARLTLLQALLETGANAEAAEQARRLPAGAARDRFLGESLLALGQADSAAVHLRRAHQGQPDSDAAALLLGRAELALGDAAAAARVLAPAAARVEPYADVQAQLAAAYRALGRTAAADSAARAYKTTLRRREAVEQRVDGLEKSAAGDLPGALRAFLRARELDPGLADLANDLGAVYARLGRFEEALAELTRAARQRPMDPAVQRNLANLYQLTGDTLRRDAAIRRFRELTTPEKPAGTTRSSRTPR